MPHCQIFKETLLQYENKTTNQTMGWDLSKDLTNINGQDKQNRRRNKEKNESKWNEEKVNEVKPMDEVVTVFNLLLLTKNPLPRVHREQVRDSKVAVQIFI